MPESKSVNLGVVFTGNANALIFSINGLRTALQELVGVTGGTNKNIGASTKQVNALGKSYNRAATSAKKFATQQKHASQAVSRQVGAVNRLKSAFKTLAAYTTAGLGIRMFLQSITSGVQEIANFDQALKNLQAITGATDAQLISMKSTILDIASSSKFSVTELADGMVLLGQSGFTAAESLSAIQSVADLATGTLSNLQVTSDLLTTTIRAFNLQAIESGRVADVMANAVNKSKLTVDKLRTAFNYVGATASQAGLSIEETAATMMVLANNGLRASTIGTGFRQVLSKMIAPSKKLRDVFASYNIELSKINPTMVGYQNSLKQLSKVLWDTKKGVVDMNKAFDLFKLRGAQAAAVIVKSYMGGDFQKAIDNLYKVGTASDMAAKQAEGMAVIWKNMKDNAKNLAISLGDGGLLGVFKGLALVLKGTIIGATKVLSSTFGKFTLQVTVLTGVFMGLVAAFRLFNVGALITGFVELGVAIKSTIASYLRFVFVHKMAVEANMQMLSILGNLVSPWVAVSAAIAATVILLYKVATATERAVKAKEAEIVSISKVLEEYKLYAGALDNLAERQAKGENVSKEYNSVITRMKKQFPELTAIIIKNKNSISDLSLVMKGYLAIKEKERIEAVAEAYQLQQKRVSELTTDYKELGDTYAEALAKGSDTLSDLNEANAKLNDFYTILIGTIIEFGKEQNYTNDQIADYAVQVANAVDPTGKLADKLKNGVVKALKEADKAVKQFTQSLADLEVPDINFSNILDIKFDDTSMKSAFHKMEAALNREITSIRKSYKDVVGMEKEKNYEIEQARLEHISKLIEMQNKGTASEAEILNKQKEALIKIEEAAREHNNRLLKMYTDATAKRKATLKQMYEEGKVSSIEYHSQLIGIEEEYQNKVLELENTLGGKRVAYIEKYRDLAVQAYQQTGETVGTFYNDLATKEEEYYQKSLAELKKDHEAKILAIQQEGDERATMLAKLQEEQAKYSTSMDKMIEQHKNKLADLAVSQGKASQAVKVLVDDLHKEADALDNAAKSAEALKNTTDELAQADADYSLRLANLKLALEKGIVTREAYRTKELELEKAHWEKMISIRKQGLIDLAAAGLKGTTEYTKALIAVRKAEIKLVQTQNKLKGNTVDAGNVMNTAGNKMKEAGEKAGESGTKAQEIWQKLADMLGTTVAKIKAALGELNTGISEAEKNLNSMSKFEAKSKEMANSRNEMSDWLWGGEKGAGSTMRTQSTTWGNKTYDQLVADKRNIQGRISSGWATANDYKALDKINDNLAKIAGYDEEQTKELKKQTAINNANNRRLNENKYYNPYVAHGYASGGDVGGTGNSDTVPAMLTPGEVVIKKSAVEKWKQLFGANFFKGLNNPMSAIGKQIQSTFGAVKKYSQGGVVGENSGLQSTQGLASDSITVNFRFGNKDFAGQYDKSVGRALVRELQKASLVAG